MRERERERKKERVPRDVFRLNTLLHRQIFQNASSSFIHTRPPSQTSEANHSRKRTEAFKSFFHIYDIDKQRWRWTSSDRASASLRRERCALKSVFPANYDALFSSSPAGCNLTKEAAEMALVRRLSIDVQVFIEKQMFVN